MKASTKRVRRKRWYFIKIGRGKTHWVPTKLLVDFLRSHKLKPGEWQVTASDGDEITIVYYASRELYES